MLAAIATCIVQAAPAKAPAGATSTSLLSTSLLASSSEDADVVRRLNARFARGAPSDRIADGGVLLHQFDLGGFTDKQQLRSDNGGLNDPEPWLPCAEGLWCHKSSDRWSASLVNARMPFVFNNINGGLIVKPEVAEEALMCSWAADGRGIRQQRTCLALNVSFDFWDGTQTPAKHLPQFCTPGCVSKLHAYVEDANTDMAGRPSPDWCPATLEEALAPPDTSGASGGLALWCPWRPRQLKAMMRQHETALPNDHCGQKNGCLYNELVLNTSVWVDSLPKTVEAVFYFASPNASAYEDPYLVLQFSLKVARYVHAALVRRYGLDPSAVPLVAFDLGATDPDGVFRAMPNDELLHNDTAFAAARDEIVSKTATDRTHAAVFEEAERMR